MDPAFNCALHSAPAACGPKPTSTGAKAGRVGGATDARDAGVPASLIQERGRWCTDIALIYQRPIVRQHLQAAAAMGGASGLELERVCDGFAQHAIR